MDASREFYEVFLNIFLTEHLRTSASEYIGTFLYNAHIQSRIWN